MPMKFRFAWVPLIATVLVVAAGVALGRWQTRRAVEKETLEQRLVAREAAPPVTLKGEARSADEMEYRRVRVRGEFVADWTVYLDNRPHDGEAGMYVLTPLKIEGTNRYVLVAQGWAKRDPNDRTRVPQVFLPGMVDIEGVVKSKPARLLQLGGAEPIRPHAIMQNLDVQAFEQEAHLSMLPFLIEQTNDTRDGLVRDWPRPATGVERHRAYAFQWYALAVTAFLFFLVTGFRRGRT